MGDCSAIKVEVPVEVIRLAALLKERGASVFLVGGWIRDAIIGIESKDVDLATDLPFEELKELLQMTGRVYALGEKFNTLGMVGDEFTFEITTLRREKYGEGSRHPEVEPADNILEDLARRDFTINAIALSLEPGPGEIIDPYGGVNDIASRILRTPRDPDITFREDPLRMMRAARFAAQLGFDMEEGVFEALKRNAPSLEFISWERKRDELEKTLVSPQADRGLRILVNSGLMDRISPEISAMKCVEQPEPYHRADVFEHTLLTVRAVSPEPLLRRAALFHDIGKPAAKVTEPKTRFPGHERLGEEITRSVMKRLRYSRDEVNKTAFLVRVHMRPIMYRPEWKDSAVRRLIRDCTLANGTETVVPLDSVFELARADIMAGSFETIEENLKLLSELQERIEEIKTREKPEEARSPLDGRELMELANRQQGPWIRQVKEHLTEMVLEGKITQEDKEGARKLALRFMEDRGLL